MGRRHPLLLLPSVALALAVGAGGGCAARISHVSTSQQQAGSLAPPSRYVAADEAEDAAIPASASASALVFRPPVAAGEQMPDLSRAARQPSAFVGFEDPIIEYCDVTTIDRQVAGGRLDRSGSGFGWCGGASCDRYERRAVTEKIGVLHR
jgi:hypothetical protein